MCSRNTLKYIHMLAYILNNEFDDLSTDVKVAVILDLRSLQRSQDCKTLMCNVVCPIQFI